MRIFKNFKTFPKYQIVSDFREPQIEKDVSNYLGWISDGIGLPFKLSSADENVTGADAVFDCAIPLYIQFKVSLGLKSTDEVSPSKRKNRSSLEDIRIFRRDENLPDNPTLCFELRQKARHAIDFQHNILMDYAVPGKSYAFYVAPLSLTKNEYEKSLFDSSEGRFMRFPFIFHDNLKVRTLKGFKYIGAVPFLRQHISITPHVKVDTHKHHYSYSNVGTDIVWHSKSEILPIYVSRLSDTLQDILFDAVGKKEQWISLLELDKQLIKLEEKYEWEKRAPNLNSPLTSIHKHGNLLNENYNIKLILILSNRKSLDAL
jgi:hypothetical protein